MKFLVKAQIASNNRRPGGGPGYPVISPGSREQAAGRRSGNGSELLLFLFFVFIFLISLSSNASTLPDLGDVSENTLSPKETHELTQNFLRDLHQGNEIIGDPLLNEYVNTLGRRLIQSSRNPTHKISYVLIANPAINAFAGPADIIGIFSGLFSATKTESELAAVMAHETSHIMQRHLLRTIAKAKHMRLPLLLSSAAAIALSVQNPNLGQGALMGTMAGFQQDMINFTRAQEKEADRIGIDMLYHAQFDPTSMASFFLRLQDNERYSYSSNVPEILRTHPVTESRIADAKNRAAEWPRKNKNYHSSLMYELMKQRCTILASNNFDALLAAKRSFYAKDPENPVAIYGYALSLIRARQIKDVKPLIEKLLKYDKDEVVYQLLAANYFSAINDFGTALHFLKNAHYIYPNDYPVIIQYGKTLITANQAADAEKMMQQVVYKNPKNITYLLLLAEAQAANKHQAAAYFSKAQAMLESGEPEYAYDQLRIARKLAKDDYLLTQIKALQDEIKSPRHSS